MKATYIPLLIVLLFVSQHCTQEPKTSTNIQDNNVTHKTTVNTDWSTFLAEFPAIECPFKLEGFSDFRRFSLISKQFAQKFVQGALQAKPSPKQHYRYVGKLEALNYWSILIYVDPQGSTPGYYWAQTYARSGKILDQEILAGQWDKSCQSIATIKSATTIETIEMGLSDSIMALPKPLAIETNIEISENGHFFIRIETNP